MTHSWMQAKRRWQKAHLLILAIKVFQDTLQFVHTNQAIQIYQWPIQVLQMLKNWIETKIGTKMEIAISLISNSQFNSRDLKLQRLKKEADLKRNRSHSLSKLTLITCLFSNKLKHNKIDWKTRELWTVKMIMQKTDANLLRDLQSLRRAEFQWW